MSRDLDIPIIFFYRWTVRLPIIYKNLTCETSDILLSSLASPSSLFLSFCNPRTMPGVFENKDTCFVLRRLRRHLFLGYFVYKLWVCFGTKTVTKGKSSNADRVYGVFLVDESTRSFICFSVLNVHLFLSVETE